eukprot:16920-Heterococcus_DN1.PRE.4
MHCTVEHACTGYTAHGCMHTPVASGVANQHRWINEATKLPNSIKKQAMPKSSSSSIQYSIALSEYSKTDLYDAVHQVALRDSVTTRHHLLHINAFQLAQPQQISPYKQAQLFLQHKVYAVAHTAQQQQAAAAVVAVAVVAANAATEL